MKMKKYILFLIGAVSLAACAPKAGDNVGPDTRDIRSFEDLQAYFTYNPDRDIVISAHRGGMVPSYPENCPESCEHTLSMIPAFFEIDFSFTKDSVLVMMHDLTLDRCSTGKGRICDYTLEELRQLRLVDRYGQVTPFGIPTLKEMLEWGDGKAVFNFDNKYINSRGVSEEEKRGALEYYARQLLPGGDWAGYHNIMLSVRSLDEAMFYWNKGIHDIMFDVEISTPEDYDAYDASPIPWDHILAYVRFSPNPEMYDIYNRLHEHGVMIQTSVAPTSDVLMNPLDRRVAHLQDLLAEPDVIETDYPAEFVDLPRSRKALRDLRATYRK